MNSRWARIGMAWLLMVLAGVEIANAETRVWTGASTNGLWSNAENWSNGIPVSGDSLLFPVLAVRPPLNPENDLAGLVVDRLTLQGVSYRLVGTPLAIQSGIYRQGPIAGSFGDVGLPIRLVGRTIDFFTDSNGGLRISGSVEASADVTVVVSGGDVRLSFGPGTSYLAETWFQGGFYPLLMFGARIAGPIRIGGVASFTSVVIQSGNQFSNFPRVTVLSNAVLMNVASLAALGPLSVSGGGLTLNGAAPNGRISVLGDAEFRNGSALTVSTLSSGVPGELSVTGRVVLADCLLTLNQRNNPITNTYVIVRKESVGPVEGTFRGVPEGGVVSDGTDYIRISYRGGDGNDVTVSPLGKLALTEILVPAPGAVLLRGVAATNLSLSLEFADDVAPAVWKNIGIQTVSDAAGQFELIDAPLPGTSRRFYRVTAP